MKRSRSKYLHKLIVYAIGFVTVPMLALGIFSYIHSSRTVQQRVNDGALQMLLQMQQRVEQSLRSADNALTQFTLQPAILGLLAADAGKAGPIGEDSIRLLREGMQRMRQTELGAEEAVFVHLRDRWKVTSGGYAPAAADDPMWKQANEAPPGSRWTIGSGTIDFVKTLPIGSPQPVAAVVLRVPLNGIGQLMFRHPELGEPFILDDMQRVVAHADRWTRIGSSVAEMPYARQLIAMENGEGLFKTELDGEPYNVMFSKSFYNGWTYVSLVSVTEMTREAQTIKWVTLAASGVLLLIGAAVSLLGANRLYGPIRRLYDSVFQTEEKDDTAGRPSRTAADELTLIGERVQAALQNQRQLNRELKSQRERLQHFFMLRLYLGQTEAGERAFYETAHMCGWQTMSVLVLQIDSLEEAGYSERDQELLLFAITNMVAEIVPPGDRLLEPIVMGFSQVTLVGSPITDRQAYSEWLDDLAKRIGRTVKQYLRLPVSIGVSSPFRSLHDAARGYKEASEALQYRIRLGHEAVIHIGDVRPDRSRVPEYPEKVKDELLEAIRMGDGRRAFELLERFAQDVFAAPLSPRQYQVLMIGLLTDVLRCLQEYEGVLHSLYEEEKQLYDRIFELNTSAEMIGWMHQNVIMPAIRLLEDRRTKQQRGITDELLRMIEHEYDRPLTVEQCAFRIHYHPDYVRHVFRKEVGMPFSEYLAQYRLQIAKRWLTSTDMKIAEIAARLQYTNAQNFIRYFRKMEGMTPGQYRENRNAGLQENL
jgi:AraC-like DNA-binding protein